MYISLNWLKDFVEIPDLLDKQVLADEITLKTAEVEKVTKEAEAFENIVVGHVVTMLAHPNADKLRIAKTSIGKETVQIVCGGENLKEGMYVVVAKPGAKVRWHGEGDLITLEKTKIRGEESFGMICASSEIGIDNPEEGPRDIMDLSALKPKTGTPLSELFEKNDIILEFDNKSLTHRPDLWGHYGIAREIAAITNKKFTPLKPSVKIPEKGESVKVEIKNFELCPRYCGLIIKNIKVAESPDWIKKRLKATGHGTHNNIIDITNYVMTELGQPMHAFDKTFIEGGITVRTAEKNEKIVTLDGKENKLATDMLVIADHKKALAIAGVIGGEKSGITEKTTEIILESANFNAASVRRTSTKIGTRTDSVQRFEKSLDPHLAELAILRAAELILKVCPDAEIAGPITDIKKFNETPIKIDLDLQKAISKIGVDISKKEIKEIFEKLEFKIEEKNSETLTLTVPTFRASKDISIEDDLIEEIARIYGYDNIPATLPALPTQLPQENTERFKKHKTRELLSYGLGFNETTNYSFYGADTLAACLLPEDGHLKILNFLSEDQTHMRTTLVPNLLKNLQVNVKILDEIRIYEIGRTYIETGDFYPKEEKKVSGAILKGKKEEDPFYEAKGVVEAFFERFNLKKIKIAKGVKNAPYAHPGKSVSYIDEHGQTVAEVFSLHPIVQKNHDLGKYSIALFEINFTEATKLEQPTRTFQALPKFPSINIDISVLVNRTTEIGAIREAIRKANEKLVTQAELFDIYEGENMGKDKKSVAFKVTLQAPERTLTDEEMTQIQSQIFKNLEKLGGIIRGK